MLELGCQKPRLSRVKNALLPYAISTPPKRLPNHLGRLDHSESPLAPIDHKSDELPHTITSAQNLGIFGINATHAEDLKSVSVV